MSEVIGRNFEAYNAPASAGDTLSGVDGRTTLQFVAEKRHGLQCSMEHPGNQHPDDQQLLRNGLANLDFLGKTREEQLADLQRELVAYLGEIEPAEDLHSVSGEVDTILEVKMATEDAPITMDEFLEGLQQITPEEWADMGVDAIPFINTGKAIGEVALGRKILTGQQVARGGAIIDLIIDAAPGVKQVKTLLKLVRKALEKVAWMRKIKAMAQAAGQQLGGILPQPHLATVNTAPVDIVDAPNGKPRGMEMSGDRESGGGISGRGNDGPDNPNEPPNRAHVTDEFGLPTSFTYLHELTPSLAMSEVKVWRDRLEDMVRMNAPKEMSQLSSFEKKSLKDRVQIFDKGMKCIEHYLKYLTEVAKSGPDLAEYGPKVKRDLQGVVIFFEGNYNVNTVGITKFSTLRKLKSKINSL